MSKATYSAKFDILFSYLVGKIPKEIDTIVITGGRGSGKSYPVADFVCQAMASFDKFNTLYTRYTLTSAGTSIVPEFREKIELHGFNMRAVFKDHNHIIEDKNNGNVLYFKGIKTSSGNQTANLKGIKDASIWVLDEAEEMPHEAEFDKIQLSIRSNHHQALTILILNPTHKKHWIYNRFFRRANWQPGATGVRDNVAYIHTTYLDNYRNLPKNILRSYIRMRDNDPAKYKTVVMGGWLDQAEGLIFTNFTSLSKRPQNLELLGYGLDFGFASDPAAFVAAYRNYDTPNGLFLETMVYETGLFNKSLFDAIVGTPKFDRNKYIVADSAEPKTIQELAKMGLNITPAKKGAGSVAGGISKMHDFELSAMEIDYITGEMHEYVWDKSPIEDKYTNEPAKGQSDHAIDAARYFIQKIL